MRYLIESIVTVIFLLVSTPCNGQPFQVEVSVSGQGIEGPGSAYGNDISVYPDLTVAYQVAEHHRIGLTFSVLSGSLDEPRYAWSESGTNLQVTSYPIGLEYQFRMLGNALLHPYLKTSLLAIPTKDGWETDTPASHTTTINGGVNFGLGADWKLTGRWGMFSTINYRLIIEDSDRPAQKIDLDGFNAQLGAKVYL